MCPEVPGRPSGINYAGPSMHLSTAGAAIFCTPIAGRLHSQQAFLFFQKIKIKKYIKTHFFSHTLMSRVDEHILNFIDRVLLFIIRLVDVR